MRLLLLTMLTLPNLALGLAAYGLVAVDLGRTLRQTGPYLPEGVAVVLWVLSWLAVVWASARRPSAQRLAPLGPGLLAFAWIVLGVVELSALEGQYLPTRFSAYPAVAHAGVPALLALVALVAAGGGRRAVVGLAALVPLLSVAGLGLLSLRAQATWGLVWNWDRVGVAQVGFHATTWMPDLSLAIGALTRRTTLDDDTLRGVSEPA